MHCSAVDEWMSLVFQCVLLALGWIRSVGDDNEQETRLRFETNKRNNIAVFGLQMDQSKVSKNLSYPRGKKELHECVCVCVCLGETVP